jgi:hypothetical protein
MMAEEQGSASLCT